MKRLAFRPTATKWLVAPTFALGVLLSGCNSQPTATEPEKTATVVPEETNEASDSAATTAPAEGAGAGSTTSGAGGTTSGK
jgi:hypothetical protein